MPVLPAVLGYFLSIVAAAAAARARTGAARRDAGQGFGNAFFEQQLDGEQTRVRVGAVQLLDHPLNDRLNRSVGVRAEFAEFVFIPRSGLTMRLVFRHHPGEMDRRVRDEQEERLRAPGVQPE